MSFNFIPKSSPRSSSIEYFESFEFSEKNENKRSSSFDYLDEEKFIIPRHLSTERFGLNKENDKSPSYDYVDEELPPPNFTGFSNDFFQTFGEVVLYHNLHQFQTEKNYLIIQTLPFLQPLLKLNKSISILIVNKFSFFSLIFKLKI